MSGSALILALTLAGAGSVEHPHRVQVTPLAVQLDSKFTHHQGIGLRYSHEIRPGFGLTIGGHYNFVAEPTRFTRELIASTREGPSLAASALLRWHVWAGFEVSPLKGLAAGRPVGLTLSVGAGPVSLGVLPGPREHATWIDVGFRLGGAASLEGRWAVTDRWTLVMGLTTRIFPTGELIAAGSCVFAGKDEHGPVMAACLNDPAGNPRYPPSSDDASFRYGSGSSDIVNLLSLTAGVQARF